MFPKSIQKNMILGYVMIIYFQNITFTTNETYVCRMKMTN